MNQTMNQMNTTKLVLSINPQSTNKHELPSLLVTLVADPPHDNDEMVISNNESNTSERRYHTCYQKVIPMK